MRPPTGEMMLVSSAWLTVWHRRFCVALCCTGLHRWLRGEILANLTIKAQRLDNKLPGDGGTEGLYHRAVLADSGCIMLHRLHWIEIRRRKAARSAREDQTTTGVRRSWRTNWQFGYVFKKIRTGLSA